ncbi:hypothetical protein ANCCAN_18704, partial [Ancylostoma caninum]
MGSCAPKWKDIAELPRNALRRRRWATPARLEAKESQPAGARLTRTARAHQCNCAVIQVQHYRNSRYQEKFLLLTGCGFKACLSSTSHVLDTGIRFIQNDRCPPTSLLGIRCRMNSLRATNWCNSDYECQ